MLYSRWKNIVIWLVVLASILLAAPNLISNNTLSSLPSWFPARKMMLGLDLQGGSHVMLKMERFDVVQARLEAAVNDVGARLRDAGIAYTGLSGVNQTISFHVTDPGQLDAAKAALQPLTTPVATGAWIGGSVVEARISDDAEGGLKVDLTNDGMKYRLAQALEQSIAVVQARAAELPEFVPQIERQGPDRIVVQVPGLVDPQRLKSLLNQRGALSFHLLDSSMPVQQAVDGTPPPGGNVLYSMDDPPTPFLVQRTALFASDDLADLSISVDAAKDEPGLNFRLTPPASEAVARVTAENATRPVAVVFDEQVLQTVPLNQLITNGAGRITGDLSVEGASDMAAFIRSGPLPSTLTVVEERTAGSGLGADSVRAALIAGTIAAIAVVVFMIAFYGTLGVIATIALIVNLIMIIALMTLLGAALTLPGVAGIVLIIGMAVDSNVLIYERIRDEARGGGSVTQAIRRGFRRARIAIIDANMTALIAAVVLLFIGSGSIRGFAVTLIIGILTTVFTAFTLTRWMTAALVHRRQHRNLPKGIRTGIFDGTNIAFMGIRRTIFLISGAVMILCTIGYGTIGMNLGIDFRGGSVIEAQARQGEADIVDIAARLGELNLADIQVEHYGNARNVLLRVPAQGGGENAEQSVITLVRGELEESYEFRRVEVVGPSVSGQLTLQSTFGVLTALAAILVYIWVRFAWQFAIGAIIATLHDVILIIGLFVFTGMDFNLTSVAAILTVVGYSLNDTLVVYSRMRENLRRYPQMPLPVLIDTSINQTLSRTILTSATALMATAALYLFGGGALQSFALVMFFGIVVATFSSIYIAAPVLIAFRLRSLRPLRGRAARREAATRTPA